MGLLKIKAPPEFGIRRVPKDLKIMGNIDYFVLWSSLGVGLLVLQAGGILTMPPEEYGFGLGFMELLLVSIIGSVIGSMLLALAGLVGEREGIPTMVSLRPSFGKYGSYLPTILNIIQLIGWATFEIIIMGEAAEAISGIEGSRPLWIIFFGLLAYLMAIGGPLRVVRQWLEKFAIWLVYISTIWITYNVFTSGVTLPLFRSGSLSSYLLALDLVIAMPVSWIPLVSDYNRFAKGSGSSGLGTFLGYTISNTWFYVLGGVLIIVYAGQSIVSSIAILFYGTIALLLILVDETDNAFADVYSAAVSLQNIGPKVRVASYASLIALISIVLGLIIPIAEYEHFLLLIGASFIPVTSILITDYFIVKRRKYNDSELYPENGGVRFEAIASWIIGFITYYLLAYIYPVVGATIPTLLSTATIYLILSRMGGVWR